MWIIAAGDIHMDGRYLLAIKEIAPADLLPLEGDLTNFGRRADAEKVMAQARQANPSVLAQFGNLDHRGVDDYLETETIGCNRHNPAVIIDANVCLAGIGGSNPTPFGTPSEFSEDARGSISSKAICQARQLITQQQRVEKKQIPLMLVSHAPPYQSLLDRLADGPCACSVAVRGCIYRARVTGSLHLRPYP